MTGMVVGIADRFQRSFGSELDGILVVQQREIAQ